MDGRDGGMHWRVVLLVVAAMTVTGGASASAHESHPEGAAACSEILQGTTTGGLEAATTPPEGSKVQPGGVVEVTLRWDPDEFDGDELHVALHCVTVDGVLAEALSALDRDGANDGKFAHSFTVPAGLPDGTKVCDRGYVSSEGDGEDSDTDSRDEDSERVKSTEVCFQVISPAPEVPAVTAPAPAPPAPSTAPSPPPVAAAPAPQPDVVQGADLARQQAAVTQPVPLDTLPRTGSPSRAVFLLAGLALLGGGGAVALSVPRPRRARR
jgi:hypothetical protein